MSTYLQALRVAFWALPLQRWCTVVGGIMVCAAITALAATTASMVGEAAPDWNIPFISSSAWTDWLTFGHLVAFGIPALLAGAMWRAVSSPVRIGLAPHGRARLLLAAFGVTVTVSALLVASNMLFYFSSPWLLRFPTAHNGQIVVMKVMPPVRTSLILYTGMFVGTFASATWWVIASFIVSRSPLAMLLVIVACIACFFGLDYLGIDSVRLLWRRPWGIVLPLALWMAFGAWYLKARRIAPPGWLLPGAQSILASVVMPGATVVTLARRAALERLMLGGASVQRILFQWLIAGGLLLFLLMLMARRGEGEAVIVAHIAFGALIACPAIVAVQSMAIVRRARALWLPSGYTRVELFAFTERTLLKFALGMSLLFAAFLVLLWFTQPWHPALTLVEALLVVLLPSLQLASHSLTATRGWDFYWRWPLVLLLCWFVAWKPLTVVDPISAIGPHGWLWFLVAGIATLWFHLLARRHWLGGDFPRAAVST